LTNQMRRAAVAIPANIDGGQGRNAAKEGKDLPAGSSGRLADLEFQPIIAKETEYLHQEGLNPFPAAPARTRKMSGGLAKVIPVSGWDLPETGMHENSFLFLAKMDNLK
jgi:four helix bundle protein